MREKIAAFITTAAILLGAGFGVLFFLTGSELVPENPWGIIMWFLLLIGFVLVVVGTELAPPSSRKEKDAKMRAEANGFKHLKH